MTKVEIVTAANKRAPLRSLGAAGGESSEAGAARFIGIVAAINCSIEIKPMVEPGCVQPASSTIDVDITARLERGPGMRVLAHRTDRQLIADPVIDSQAESAGIEVVTVCIPITVHIDKVTESSHPHAPAVLRPGLKDRFHDVF